MAKTKNPLNFIKVTDPHSLKLPKKFLTKGLVALGIFMTGYSAAPAGYAEPTQRYEEGFVDALRAQGMAPVPITSPTTSPGSIDTIGTVVAHNKKTDILYVTATEYLPYVNPEELPKEVDRKRFVATAKYHFDNKDAYSRASAIACDVTEVTGGRDTAVRDFMNALQEGKTVILAHNARLPTGYDAEKNRPNNAEEYLESMIKAQIGGETPPYPAVSGFDSHYVINHLDRIKLVKIDDVDTPQYMAAPTIGSLWHEASAVTGVEEKPTRGGFLSGKPKLDNNKLQ